MNFCNTEYQILAAELLSQELFGIRKLGSDSQTQLEREVGRLEYSVCINLISKTYLFEIERRKHLDLYICTKREMLPLLNHCRVHLKEEWLRRKSQLY